MRGIKFVVERFGGQDKSQFLQYITCKLGSHNVQVFEQCHDLKALRLQFAPHCEYFFFNLSRGAKPTEEWF